MYVVEMILKSRIDGGVPAEPLLEYRIVTLAANSSEQAEELVARYTDSARESFRNEFGETVEWTVVDVVRIESAMTLGVGDLSGHEVWSQSVTEDEADWFRRMRRSDA
jgi:hypothetical protein